MLLREKRSGNRVNVKRNKNLQPSTFSHFVVFSTVCETRWHDARVLCVVVQALWVRSDVVDG